MYMYVRSIIQVVQPGPRAAYKWYKYSLNWVTNSLLLSETMADKQKAVINCVLQRLNSRLRS